MEGGPPGFGRGFTCPALLGIPVGHAQAFGYGAFTLSGSAFQRIRLTSRVPRPGPATPECKHSGLASCAFARHYSRNRVCFPFLGVLRCFTSPGVARNGLMEGGGFPHSDIRGSKPADGSPRLFAVCRVLHRLTVPRHPSCARIRLARYNLASRYVAILFKSSTSVFKDRKNGAERPSAGGGSRIRTGDILLAKQALYQLSYTPGGIWWA